MLRQLSTCAFLALALVPPGRAGGDPGTLWNQYPLEQRTAGSATTPARAQRSPRALATVKPPAPRKTRAKAEDSAPLPLAERLEVVLPFGLVLFGAAVVAGRRRRENEVGVERSGVADEEVNGRPPVAEVKAHTPVEEVEMSRTMEEVATPPPLAQEAETPAPVEQDHWGWLDEIAPDPVLANPHPTRGTRQPEPVEDATETRPEEPLPEPSLANPAAVQPEPVEDTTDTRPAEPSCQEQPQSEPAFLLFVETATGYELLEGHGSSPHVGGAVELADGNGGARFVVTRMGPSPFPDDPRRCAYLERQVFTVD